MEHFTKGGEPKMETHTRCEYSHPERVYHEPIHSHASRILLRIIYMSRKNVAFFYGVEVSTSSHVSSFARSCHSVFPIPIPSPSHHPSTLRSVPNQHDASCPTQLLRFTRQ